MQYILNNIIYQLNFYREFSILSSLYENQLYSKDMTYYLYENNVPKTLEFTKIITLERIKQNLQIWTITKHDKRSLQNINY